MKLNLKHVSAVGALLALSSTAFADTTQAEVNGLQTNTGADSLTGAQQGASTFSSLLFFAYNPDGTFSHVQTLGIRGSTSTSTSPATPNFSNVQTNDPGTVLNFSLNNVAGLTANASTLRWGIMAYDKSGNYTTAAAFNLLSTVNDSSIVTGGGAVPPNSAGIINTGTSIENFLIANPSNSNDSVSFAGPGPGPVDNWVTNNGALANLTSTINAVGTASATLAMYMFSNISSADTSSFATATAYAGTWTLNALTGVASYTVGAAVPVPAAVWLLLSGLGGLGVVGRRRAVAAA